MFDDFQPGARGRSVDRSHVIFIFIFSFFISSRGRCRCRRKGAAPNKKVWNVLVLCIYIYIYVHRTLVLCSYHLNAVSFCVFFYYYFCFLQYCLYFILKIENTFVSTIVFCLPIFSSTHTRTLTYILCLCLHVKGYPRVKDTPYIIISYIYMYKVYAGYRSVPLLFVFYRVMCTQRTPSRFLINIKKARTVFSSYFYFFFFFLANQAYVYFFSYYFT